MYDAFTCYFCCVTDDATVTDLWEKHFSTLSTVCIMLDDMDCPYNYKHLASWLGISGSTLRTFKYGDSSESPSMIVLKILETQKPNLSTDHMVVALTSWGLKPIAEELKCQPPGGWIACSNSIIHIFIRHFNHQFLSSKISLLQAGG